MSYVPSALFQEILLRLPTESLFRLIEKCDQSFIKAHTSNQLYNHTLLLRNQTGAPLYSFSLDSLNFITGPQQVDAMSIKQLIRNDVPRLPILFDVALCNGLILISHEKYKKIWAIWNPLTGDCIELPRPNGPLDFAGFGFGYDGNADDYKVVRIDELSSSGGEVVFRVLVYSPKSGTWSTIEGFPQNCSIFKYKPGVSLNGTLYWESLESILALDLTTETYFQLSLPPAPRMDSGSRLSALDGCLFLTYARYYIHYGIQHFDGWMMKHNGVEKSWIEMFSLPCSGLSYAPRDMNLVAYLKSKRQVVLQDDRGYLWVDLESNSVKKFSIHGFPHISSAQICPGSLVRLGVHDSAIEFGAESSARNRKRKIKKTDARLKFCVRDAGENCCSDNESCFADMCRLCKLNEE